MAVTKEQAEIALYPMHTFIYDNGDKFFPFGEDGQCIYLHEKQTLIKREHGEYISISSVCELGKIIREVAANHGCYSPINNEDGRIWIPTANHYSSNYIYLLCDSLYIYFNGVIISDDYNNKMLITLI